MKNMISSILLILPAGAFADHVDVIEAQLTDTCGFSKYLEIVSDFNTQWGKNNGYRAEILAPIQSNNLTSIFWVGRSANTAAFGKAFDQWSKDLMDPNSTASKLWARFQECSTNLGRRGYQSY